MTAHNHKHTQGLGHLSTGYTEIHVNCLSHTVVDDDFENSKKGVPLTYLQRAFLLTGIVVASIPEESEYFSIRKMHIAGMQY